MQLLQRLGLQKSWIYEVLISTFSEGIPHAAPIGIWTEDFGTLHMYLYAGSHTLENVLANRCFVANLPPDESQFAIALLQPEKLAYLDAGCVRAPVLSRATATVELSLAGTVHLSDRVHVVGTVVGGQEGDGVRLVNRAAGLLVESLVLATRLPRLDRDAVCATLKDNHRVVEKVAPGSPYAEAMARLLWTLEMR